jgi:hypothetical protein
MTAWGCRVLVHHTGLRCGHGAVYIVRVRPQGRQPVDLEHYHPVCEAHLETVKSDAVVGFCEVETYRLGERVTP